MVVLYMAPVVGQNKTRRGAGFEYFNWVGNPSLLQPTHYGRFSRHWQDEEALDVLIDKLEAGQLSHKQALMQARKLEATEAPSCGGALPRFRMPQCIARAKRARRDDGAP